MDGSALSTLDGPALARLWRSGNGDAMVEVAGGLVEAAGAAKQAARLAGVQPGALASERGAQRPRGCYTYALGCPGYPRPRGPQRWWSGLWPAPVGP